MFLDLCQHPKNRKKKFRKKTGTTLHKIHDKQLRDGFVINYS